MSVLAKQAGVPAAYKRPGVEEPSTKILETGCEDTEMTPKLEEVFTIYCESVVERLKVASPGRESNPSQALADLHRTVADLEREGGFQELVDVTLSAFPQRSFVNRNRWQIRGGVQA